MSMKNNIDGQLVGHVAEVCIEPRYISEAARVLRANMSRWREMSHNVAVSYVSQAVSLLEEEGRIEVTVYDYDGFGGQVEGSPRSATFFSEDQREVFGEGGMWRPYNIAYNRQTDIGSVRHVPVDVIDPNVTIEQKASIADRLSRVGNDMARYSELILQDHIDRVIDQVLPAGEELDYVDKSHYQSPGADLYLEYDGVGYVVEVSTRYVNPIDSPYVSHKINQGMNMEVERGVPVNVLIMAPRFTSDVNQRYFGDDMVTLRKLPSDTDDGNPVIVPDSPEVQEMAIGTGIVGDNYPIVEDNDSLFISFLDEVLRDYSIVEELEYRRMISTIAGEEIQP